MSDLPRQSDFPISRRAALRLAAGLALLPALGGLAAPAPLAAQGTRRRDPVKHPDPRPDVTAERVLPEEKVPKKHREAYQGARDYPETFDGVFCHCDCAERDGRRSLLSCFESEMPFTCSVCTGEAKVVAKLRKEGKGLEEIRKAVDERYG